MKLFPLQEVNVADSATFTPGPVPSDGWLSGALAGGGVNSGELEWIQPTVTPGQRLTGTVSIGVGLTGGGLTNGSVPAGNPVRLVLDGVPLTAWGTGPWSIDTTTIANGSHALGAQFQNAPPATLFGNGSLAVVVNNSGSPIQSLTHQVICGASHISTAEGGLAFGWVNVQPRVAYPRNPTKGNRAVVSGDQATLDTGSVWWAQSALGENASLYHINAYLMANEHGDWFVHRAFPGGPLGDGNTPIISAPSVWTMPQYDGGRCIATVSPYATIVPDPVPDPVTGICPFLGVDLSGRVFSVSATDLSVKTIFGPRSVAGKVQTYPTESMTLDQRVAAGEKEFVGTGPFVEGAFSDLAIMATDTDLVDLADMQGGQIVTISRSQQKIVSTQAIPNVSSVWCGLGGMWCVDGSALRKNGTVFASIAGAFWVRGDPTINTLYVLTLSLGLYSVDATSGAVTQLVAGSGGTNFVFMYVDIYGTMGTRGAVYYSAIDIAPGNASIYKWVPGGPSPTPQWTPNIFNGFYSNGSWYWQAVEDPVGHYPWLLCGHPTHAIVLVAGTANQGWHCLTGYLNGKPPVNLPGEPSAPSGWNTGFFGVLDQKLGPAALFGMRSHGTSLGFNPRRFHGMTAAQMTAALEAISPGWGAFTPYVWGQQDADPF